MFHPWRIRLCQANDAFRGGRLEEAGRLLCESGLREFRPAKQLLAQVIDRRVREAEKCLSAGEPAAALARLDELDRRHAETSKVRAAREAAGRIAAAQRFARRGDFARAEEQWGRAAALLPHIGALEAAARACNVKAAESRQLAARLHDALAGERWPEVLRSADALLEICPEHEAAREARRRAWSAVGVELSHPKPNLHSAIRISSMNESTNAYPGPSSRPRQSLQPSDWRPIDRFLLWVDGVGGYLVCACDEVTLGQPVPESQVDVPILGDVSRRHAKIRRDGEAYLIDPRRPVRLDGRIVDRPTTLADGAVIELGNVRLRFFRPHPLSATARLEFVSPHRTQPSADAVLLLAESCVLGPGAQSHVQCGDWSRELILYRQADELHCRRKGPFEIDGRPAAEGGRLTLKSQVSGQDFSLSIEGLVVKEE